MRFFFFFSLAYFISLCVCVCVCVCVYVQVRVRLPPPLTSTTLSVTANFSHALGMHEVHENVVKEVEQRSKQHQQDKAQFALLLARLRSSHARVYYELPTAARIGIHDHRALEKLFTENEVLDLIVKGGIGEIECE